MKNETKEKSKKQTHENEGISNKKSDRFIIWTYNVISLKRHTSIYVCTYACMHPISRDASFLSFLFSLQLLQLDSLLFILTKSMTLHLVIDLITKHSKEKKSIRKMVVAAAGNKVMGEKWNKDIRETISNENRKIERRKWTKEKKGKNRKAHKREVIIIMMMLMLRDDDTILWWKWKCTHTKAETDRVSEEDRHRKIDG